MNRCLTLIPALLLVGCSVPSTRESETLHRGTNVLSEAQIDSALSGRVMFKQHVWPIIQAKCLICHDGQAQPNGIRLDSRKAAGNSGVFGAFIVPGVSEESLFITKITGASAHIKAMPPVGERVTQEEIDILRRWIDQGASWPSK